MLMDLKARLGEIIACSRTNQEFLEGAARSIREICGSRWLGLYRIDHSRSLAENLVFTGGPAPAHPTFALNRGLTGLAVTQKNPVVVADVSKAPHYLPTLQDTQSEAIIPVLVGDSVVGTIDVESPTPNAFTEEVITALEGCTAALAPFLSTTGTGRQTSARIRPAVPRDLGGITAIHNYYVENTHITFDVHAFSVEQRQPWFVQHCAGARYRLLVAEDEQQGIVGYATSGQFRTKAAYDTTVEISVQCAPNVRGQGLGTRLYAALFQLLEGEDIHCAVAGIAQPNPASFVLHERMGFQVMGSFNQVGRKFDRYWDVLWMQKMLCR